MTKPKNPPETLGIDIEQLSTVLEANGAKLEKPEEQVAEAELTPDEFEKLALTITEGNRIDKEATTLPLTEKEKQEAWEGFIRKIRAHEVLEAVINRSLEFYQEQYNTINPDEPIDLKMRLQSNKIQGSKIHTIFDVSLVLLLGRGGKQYKVSEKRMNFQHMKQLRDEAGWKFTLYQSMLDSIVMNSLNFYILKKDVDAGRIKPEVPTAAGNSASKA